MTADRCGAAEGRMVAPHRGGGHLHRPSLLLHPRPPELTAMFDMMKEVINKVELMQESTVQQQHEGTRRLEED